MKTDLKQPDIRIDYLGGMAPVQAEGTINGTPFYFRARYDEWSIGIGGDPVGNPDWGRSRAYGVPGGYDAGGMPSDVAIEFIEEAAAAWVNGEPV